jgi:protein N-terminal methyltransferase
VSEAGNQIDGSISKTYWAKASSDVNGMLGGFRDVSDIDLRGSLQFLALLGIQTGEEGKKKLDRAVDCGAG